MVVLRSKVATNGLPCVVSRFNAQTMYQVGSMNRTISIVLSEMHGGQVVRLSEGFHYDDSKEYFFSNISLPCVTGSILGKPDNPREETLHETGDVESTIYFVLV